MVELKAEGLAGRWWWGAGASAVQTEGACPADDWYRWERQGRAAFSGDGNGFTACYERDVTLVSALGITDYRLSINWARVIPEPGQVDREAVTYYREVLEAGSAAGLRMWICLLHSAIPTWFADTGGFTSEKALDVWLGWVDTAAALFADLAGGWMPFNTPTSYVQKAYLAGTFPPGQRDPKTAAAALRTVHTCDFEAAARLRSTGRPVCSNEALMPIFPADQSASALAAAAKLDEFVWSSWLHLARQPKYRTAFDLYGFTYYYASRVTGTRQLLPHPVDHEPGPLGYVAWPDGLALVLARLRQELPGARFVVAELGCAGGPETDDVGRCEYLVRALGHIAAAQDDGMPIDGVSLWTAVDNYEWLAGFDVSFGLFTMSREPRRSADVMRKAIQGG
ncbi:MAG TPA: family 1 glycosylhydrolase [Pseudonocardiaceae bacterium]|nr:family 1 glycosylhydrolase [Pseudonocardiaceae bacterium]